MKGYKTSNGNYITGLEIKQRKAKFKKELKEYREQQRQEEEKRQYLNNLLYLADKREQEKERKKLQEIAQKKAEFINTIGNFKLPYKQFLIAWDIINNDFFTIESDYKRSKINKDDILKVLNIIPNDLIIDYHKEVLIAL